MENDNKQNRKKRGSYLKTRQRELKAFTENIKRKLKGKVLAIGTYRVELVDMITGKKEVKFYHNVVCDAGLTMITNNLTDPTPDNDMLINYVALGDDNTAVAEGDTTLGNEVYRNAVASRTNSGKVAYVTGYFNQTETDGNYKEAGIFADATGAADSGILVSHVNIDVTKTDTQKLTIDWTLTFANA